MKKKFIKKALALLLSTALALSPCVGMDIYAQEAEEQEADGPNEILDTGGPNERIDTQETHGGNVSENAAAMQRAAEGNEFEIQDGVLVRYNGMDSSVVIPEGVKEIGNSAFRDCYQLKKVTIPEGVKKIRRYAFANCYLLKEVNMPKSVKNIYSWAFCYCSHLSEIEIPEGVKYIGAAAFEGCSGLSEIKIPGTVTRMGKRTFASCDNLEYVEIGEGVTALPGKMFLADRKLTNVQLPSTLTAIGVSAFQQCSHLSEIKIPDTVKEIGYAAFAYCSRLERVEIGEGITEISNRMFCKNRRLANIQLPSTITSIGRRAFQRTAITSIPDSVTNIAYAAFASCTALEDIRLKNVENVGEYAFAYCYNLRNAEVEGSLTKIPNSMFRNDQSLENVELPDSIRMVDAWAFLNTSLKSVRIPSNVTEIAYQSFGSCSSLEQVVLEEGLASIGEGAFSNCERLTLLKVPSSLDRMERYAYGYKEYSNSGTEGTDAVSEWVICENTKIQCYRQSEGHRYAIDNDISVSLLDDEGQNGLPEIPGVTVENYTGAYDKAEHGITVTAPEGAQITYSLDGRDYVETNPSFIKGGEYTIYYKVEKEGYRDKFGKGFVVIEYPEIEGIIAKGYEGFYDGYNWKHIEVTAPEGAQVLYSTNGKRYTETNPSFYWQGEHKVYYKVMLEDHKDFYGVEYVRIKALESSGEPEPEYPKIEGVIAKGYEGYYDGELHSIEVTAPEGAQISYSMYKNRNYSEKKPAFRDVGEYTIYYRVYYTVKRYSQGETYIIIKSPEIEGVHVSGYDGNYDGKVHSITVTAPEDAEVFYSLDTGVEKNYTKENPSFTEAGEYTVYYKITKPDCQDMFGSAQVIIRLPQIEGIRVSGYEGVYDGKAHSITITALQGTEIFYSLDAGEEKTYTKENPSFTEVGEYTVYYKVTKSGSQDAFGSAQVIIRELSQLEGVSANGYEGYYDGKGHSITVTAPEGAEISYSCDAAEEKTYTKENPSFTEVGEYTVYYKVTKSGSQDVLGSAQVIIRGLLKLEGVSAKGYDGSYDGKSHSITVTAPKGSEVYYSCDAAEDKSYTKKNPSFKEIGQYTVYYKVTKTNYQDILGAEKVIIRKASSGGTNSDTKPGSANPKLKKKGAKINVSSSQYVVKKPGKVSKGKVNGAEVEYKCPLKKKASIQIPATITVDKITYKVTSIASNAFKNNQKLTTIKIGKNVTTIGASAFCACKKLKNVTIGTKVSTIGKNAFQNCISLDKIIIPTGVKSVGKQAFSGCRKLKTLTIKTTKLTAKNVGTKAFSGIHKKAVIKVPKKKLNAYKKLLRAKGLPKGAKLKK